MDVAAWLRGLGLARFEPAFRENEIDAEVLPELTEADLVILGLALGSRKKLLKAIAALRDKPKAKTSRRWRRRAVSMMAARLHDNSAAVRGPAGALQGYDWQAKLLRSQSRQVILKLLPASGEKHGDRDIRAARGPLYARRPHPAGGHVLAAEPRAVQ
jgi:hypothetical protein